MSQHPDDLEGNALHNGPSHMVPVVGKVQTEEGRLLQVAMIGGKTCAGEEEQSVLCGATPGSFPADLVIGQGSTVRLCGKLFEKYQEVLETKK